MQWYCGRLLHVEKEKHWQEYKNSLKFNSMGISLDHPQSMWRGELLLCAHLFWEIGLSWESGRGMVVSELPWKATK